MQEAPRDVGDLVSSGRGSESKFGWHERAANRDCSSARQRFDYLLVNKNAGNVLASMSLQLTQKHAHLMEGFDI